MNFTEGQKVIYEGSETHIETMHDNETCAIANPAWNWDEEAECVGAEIDYNIPYWITVKLTELNCA